MAEARDVNVHAALRVGFVFIGLVVFTLVLMRLVLIVLVGSESPGARPSPLAASRPEPSGPRLQVSPAADLIEMRRAEQALSTSYGWVDRDRGIVRIPIERAMDLVVERGLPARKP